MFEIPTKTIPIYYNISHHHHHPNTCLIIYTTLEIVVAHWPGTVDERIHCFLWLLFKWEPDANTVTFRQFRPRACYDRVLANGPVTYGIPREHVRRPWSAEIALFQIILEIDIHNIVLVTSQMQHQGDPGRGHRVVILTGRHEVVVPRQPLVDTVAREPPVCPHPVTHHTTHTY